MGKYRGGVKGISQAELPVGYSSSSSRPPFDKVAKEWSHSTEDLTGGGGGRLLASNRQRKAFLRPPDRNDLISSVNPIVPLYNDSSLTWEIFHHNPDLRHCDIISGGHDDGRISSTVATYYHGASFPKTEEEGPPSSSCIKLGKYYCLEAFRMSQ
ncbi:hypothetical protein ACHAXA_000267 [Cyclostephanos tholiformis]|uniref:Uncharacterized protein n=1 Tax=Cyclostephanos tholiformis TaxID=382380 RepID=A0ABD3SB63_9STRA